MTDLGNWETAIVNYNEFPLKSRTFTKGILYLANKDSQCIETESLAEMSAVAADYSYSYILENKKKAFAFCRNGGKQEREIMDISLKKKPVSSSSKHYKLLSKSKNVQTVEQAVKEVFRKDERKPEYKQLRFKPLCSLAQKYVDTVWFNKVKAREGNSEIPVIRECSTV